MKMKDRFTVTSQAFPELKLTTISRHNLEDLRVWKNTNRHWFFHDKLISPAQQLAWFSCYLDRPKDYMFMVVHRDTEIGCMAIRRDGEVLDIYNVILGHTEMSCKGFMGKGMSLMIAFARKTFSLPITLNVLISNPAVNWYIQQGFEETYRADNYLGMTLTGWLGLDVEVQHLGEYTNDSSWENV